MFNFFPKLGGKGKDVQGLLKNSVTLLGHDFDAIKPALYMTASKSIRTLVLVYALYNIAITKDIKTGVLSILSLIVLVPIISYINMRYKAITCWMIYEVLQGKDTNMAKGAKALKGRNFTLLLYSIIDQILNSEKKNRRNDNGNVTELIKGILLSIFQEVWDLIKNFSLPAIVLDKVTIKEIPEKLKELKKNIPAALTGVLGIDVIGNIITSLFGFIQLPAILISLAIGYIGKGLFPNKWLLTLPIESPVTINFLPLFFIVTCSTIFVTFLNSLVQIVKTTYFTTFYVSLNKPNKIHDSLRSDITNYLNYNNRLEGYSFFKDSKNSKLEDAHDLHEETAQDLKVIRKISNTFKKYIPKGLSEEKIYSALLKKGYPKEQLDAGLNLYHSKIAQEA